MTKDYPGFGLTEAPPGYQFTPREHSEKIEKFVDKLGIRDLTLVVQDWGGPVGLGLAGRRPELVKRLVIGNTWAWPVVGEARFEIFSWVMGGPIGRTMYREVTDGPREAGRRLPAERKFRIFLETRRPEALVGEILKRHELGGEAAD